MDANFKSKIDNLIAASGGKLWIVSGDRTEQEQQALWDQAVAQYGPDQAANWAAPPGHSNHEKGIAVDLGGDINLAHQLAPRFGLWFPMDWEPWHVEPVGSRSTDPSSYTTTPIGQSSPTTNVGLVTDVNSALSKFLGVSTAGLGGVTDSTVNNMYSQIASLAPNATPTSPPPSGMTFTSPIAGTGPDGIDRFMAAIRSHESSGNYSAEGVPTPWGTATGAYQFLDGTWNNYGGYSRAKDAPPSVQDAKARELMQQYYNQFGNWDDVAAAWYAGPGGNFQSRDVQNYVSAVRSAM